MPIRVLVVDDDADSRAVLVHYLSLAGMTTFTAADGSEALAGVRQHRPHVVLMDLTMPVMGGLDAIRQIKSTSDVQRTIVIVVTAHAQPKFIDEACAAGAECGFVKPVEPRALIAAIASLAGSADSATST